MPNIRQLLDRYGQPPSEVALDWAWQIRHQLSEAQAGDQVCLLEVDQWTQLEVADDGQLQCQQLSAQAAQSALEDLRSWAVDARSTAEPLPAENSDSISTDSVSESSQIAGREESSLVATSATLRPSRSHSRRKNYPFHLSQSNLTFRVAGTICMALVSILLLLFWPQPNSDAPIATAQSETPAAQPGDAEQGPDVTQLDSSTLLAPDLLVEPNAPAVADPIAKASTDSSSKSALGQLSLAPSLAATSQAESTVVADNQTMLDNSPTSTPENDPSPVPTAEATDAWREVQQTLEKAQATEAVVQANSNPSDEQDAHGQPWVLLRETMRYRVTVAAKLNVTRQSQWTLRLEPIEGLSVEPSGPVTISAQGRANWCIYDADAKPPRACLLVRAMHRGRDGMLDLVFCGGAEDLAGMSIPLGQRWLEPLAARIQNQSLQLQAALVRLSNSVITPEQVPAVMQRKQAMIAQLHVSNRLIEVMPDINRLAELVDGQVTLHAELRSKPDEPAIATWGQLSK